jgi:hypothetical protein
MESVTTVGELTSLKIVVKINNPITLGQVGKLRVTLPADMYYSPVSANDAITCENEIETIVCTFITIDSILGM